MVEQHVPVRPISSVFSTKEYAERGAGKGFFDLLGLSMTVSDGCREPFQPLSSLRFYPKKMNIRRGAGTGSFELIDQWQYPGQYGRFDSCSRPVPLFLRRSFFEKRSV
ncbi:hypothetical protein [Paenibacillus chitinolyticus]|uniref:hypothetical protein n=1 Tax=Paenibacillus chitinolyticus TaxID=79263 RepID=UPI00366E85F2